MSSDRMPTDCLRIDCGRVHVADIAALVQVRRVMVHLQADELPIQLAFRGRFAEVDECL